MLLEASPAGTSTMPRTDQPARSRDCSRFAAWSGPTFESVRITQGPGSSVLATSREASSPTVTGYGGTTPTFIV